MAFYFKEMAAKSDPGLVKGCLRSKINLEVGLAWWKMLWIWVYLMID